ncbi:MAG TPA: ABC transporter ATP-binding protein [Verrucomicrobiae bacterium]|nr:ABC transporter ATP-binding protein [Verrucomicrobiae bacterium]
MIRLFLPHLRPVRAMLGIGLGASVAAAAMQWAAPWPLKFIFDSVLARKPLPAWLGWLPQGRIGLLAAMVGAMLVIAVGLGVSDYVANRLVATAGQRVVIDLRLRLFRHIEAQSLGFHHRRRTGDLMARLGGDIQAIQSAMVTAVPTLSRNGLTLLGMVGIMLAVNWRYTLLAVAMAPGLFWVARHYLDRIRGVQRQARRADGEASAVAQEVLTAITVVQVSGTEATEATRYAAATRRGLEANRQAIVWQSEFTPLVTAAMTVSTVLVLYFGVQAVLQGNLTAGDLLVFMAYLRGMYSPMRQLAKLAGVVGRAQAAGERVAEILRTDETVAEAEHPRRLARARGAVSFHDVIFAYPGQAPVLCGIDLEVAAGTRQALVGATGSGKSTLLRLIPRFIDPIRGSLRLDGIDVRQLSLADLRRQIALVPQDPHLFGTSIWENILYGSHSRERAAAVTAARAAGVNDVIAALRDGYETVVAERGETLSGGQRQCVAVARAMARDAPVVLLDEPTTGMDAQLEGVLQHAMDRLADRRTTITVSHQLAGLRMSDAIAVLEAGRIKELGTHAELVRARRTYWRLQTLQTGAPTMVAAATDPPTRRSSSRDPSGDLE